MTLLLLSLHLNIWVLTAPFFQNATMFHNRSMRKKILLRHLSRTLTILRTKENAPTRVLATHFSRLQQTPKPKGATHFLPCLQCARQTSGLWVSICSESAFACLFGFWKCCNGRHGKKSEDIFEDVLVADVLCLTKLPLRFPILLQIGLWTLVRRSTCAMICLFFVHWKSWCSYTCESCGW